MADDEKIYMLNAPFFKPEGGAAKCQKYLKAVGPHMAKYGGRVTRSYHLDKSLIGESDADLLFFVEWPNPKAFEGFRADPDYRKVRSLREAAIPY